MINANETEQELVREYRNLLLQQERVDKNIQQIETCTNALENIVFTQYSKTQLHKKDQLEIQSFYGPKGKGQPAPRWQLAFYDNDDKDNYSNNLMKVTRTLTNQMQQVESEIDKMRRTIGNLELEFMNMSLTESYKFLGDNVSGLEHNVLPHLLITDTEDIKKTIGETYDTWWSFSDKIEPLVLRIDRLCGIFKTE